MENKISKINFFIAVLGVVAPACYLIGLSFHQGELAAYGVNSATFSPSVQDTYVTAYYAIGYFLLAVSHLCIDILKFLFLPPNMYWTFFYAAFFVSIIFLIIKFSKSSPSDKVYRATAFAKKVISYLHWKQNDFTKAVGITGLASYGLLSIVYVLMVLSVFWFALPVGAFYKGQKIAEQKRDVFLEKGCFIEKDKFWSNCKKLVSKDNKIIFEGILIILTKDNVAFFTKNGSIISKIPSNSQIESSFGSKNT